MDVSCEVRITSTCKEVTLSPPKAVQPYAPAVHLLPRNIIFVVLVLLSVRSRENLRA
jgi:hypothetical protein